jgi:hypothetical protein
MAASLNISIFSLEDGVTFSNGTLAKAPKLIRLLKIARMLKMFKLLRILKI